VVIRKREIKFSVPTMPRKKPTIFVECYITVFLTITYRSYYCEIELPLQSKYLTVFSESQRLWCNRYSYSDQQWSGMKRKKEKSEDFFLFDISLEIKTR